MKNNIMTGITNAVKNFANSLTKGSRNKKFQDSTQDVQVKLNDLEAVVRSSAYLDKNTINSFVTMIGRMKEIIPYTTLAALEDAKAKLVNACRSVITPGMENLILGYFSEIFWLVCESQDFENTDSVFNVMQLQARLSLIDDRQKQLAKDINDVGGVQNATRAQRIEWNRLEQSKSRINEMIEIALTAQSKDDVTKYLKDAEAQLRLCEPGYKFKKLSDNATLDDLKKVYVEYQAALRKVMQDREIIGSMGMNNAVSNDQWINPPAIAPVNTPSNTVSSTVASHVTSGIANSIPSVSANATVNNENEMQLRDIKAAVNKIDERLNRCSQELSIIDAKRAEQDSLMRSLLEHHKNENLSPAERAKLESQIHDLQRQRTTLQKTRNMWENVKTQSQNVNSLLVQMQEAMKVKDVQNLGTLGIESIEQIAMQLKEYIDQMNNNLHEIEIATNLVDDMSVEIGHTEEIPMLETSNVTSGVVEALYREFNV